jgi:hypothetical protein
MVPVLVQELTARRTRNVTEVVESACEVGGFDGPGLSEWVRASERHALYFQDAVEAAWATLDGAKLRTLGYVLADGLADDARLDVDQLVIRALRRLEAGHIQVLALVVRGRMSPTGLSAHLPHVGAAMPALLADLESAGCLTRHERERETWVGDTPLGSRTEVEYKATNFGVRCADMVRDAGAYKTEGEGDQ